MSIEVKICGLTSLEAVNTAIKSKAKYVGCSFYKNSPRNISPEFAAEITEFVPNSISKVAVTSAPEFDLLDDIFYFFKPTFLQLDDFESPERIKKIKNKYGCKIIKTIYISYEDDLLAIKDYEGVADMFLFDSRHGNDLFVELPESTFDWQLLKGLTTHKPWILSGGLNKFNVMHAARISGAKIVNASSTLESSPGIKDPRLIEAFIKAVKIESYR